MKKFANRKAIALALVAAVASVAAWLFVPPPRQARAQFADQGAWAGNATLNTGVTPNVLTITLANVSQLSDITGVQIGLNPSANNTAAVNIVITNAMGSTAATALDRPSSIGLTSLSNSELFAGETTSVKYNGSVFVLTSNVDMTRIGQAVEFRGSTAPRGSLIEDGSCVSQTTYAALFSVIGTTYGSCSAGLFALPLSNGTMFAANDNQGIAVANRITNAGSGCALTASGTFCGGQNQTLTLLQTPTGIQSSNAAFGINVTGGAPFAAITGGNTGFATAGSPTFPTFNSATPTASGTVGAAVVTSTSTNTAGLPHPVLNPILSGIRAIKY